MLNSLSSTIKIGGYFWDGSDQLFIYSIIKLDWVVDFL